MGDHFSLKIDVRNQTILSCPLELEIFHAIQMKLEGLSFQKPTRGDIEHGLKCIKQKMDTTLKNNFLICTTLLLYIQKVILKNILRSLSVNKSSGDLKAKSIRQTREE